MRLRSLFLLAACFISLQACASTPRPKIAAPDFKERNKAIIKVGIIQRGAQVFELGVGGSTELNPEWSKQASLNLTKISVEQLRTVGYDARLLDDSDLTRQIVGELSKIPSDNLSRYTYSARKIEEPAATFIAALLAKENLESVIIIGGVDHVSSAGRQAAKVALAIIGGTGVGSGVAHIELVMIDKTPALIFYCHKYEDGKDLRAESGTRELFNEIVIDLNELRSGK